MCRAVEYMYEGEEERVVCCQVGRVVWGCSTLTCKTDVPIIFMISEVDVMLGRDSCCIWNEQ